jgi:hypothetical protein
MRRGTPCPICGAKDGACGDTLLAFPPITATSTRSKVANEQKFYVPQQTVRRGRAGYKMKPGMVLVDPATGQSVPQAKKK